MVGRTSFFSLESAAKNLGKDEGRVRVQKIARVELLTNSEVRRPNRRTVLKMTYFSVFLRIVGAKRPIHSHTGVDPQARLRVCYFKTLCWLNSAPFAAVAMSNSSDKFLIQ